MSQTHASIVFGEGNISNTRKGQTELFARRNSRIVKHLPVYVVKYRRQDVLEVYNLLTSLPDTHRVDCSGLATSGGGISVETNLSHVLQTGLRPSLYMSL